MDERPATPEAAPPTGRRGAVIAGAVLFLYAAFLAVELAAAGTNTRAFGRLHQLQGNVVSRFVLAGVLLAALWHGLDGVRVVAITAVPGLRARDATIRTVTQFLTFALWVPAAFLLVWPSVWEWFS